LKSLNMIFYYYVQEEILVVEFEDFQ
jgi:hypothetical protein